MELTHRGAEGESLLRPDQRNATVMPQNTSRSRGWDSGEAEKAPFLRNEPVRLTPAWEGSNLPNDTLNLKGITMDLAPPRDRWNLIFITLILHGLGTLTAWNMFITPKDYFINYKLVNTTYAKDFFVYVGAASQIPNLLFSWCNIFIKFGGNLTTRIVWALMAEVLIFVVTVVLAMVDSSDWKTEWFWLTLVLIFALNMFNAIFQNSVFGVAARLPPQYTGAVVLGSNVCGTLVSVLSLLSRLFSDNPRTSAIYFFIGGMFVLLVCFDTYFALPLNRYYRYHDTLQQRTMRMNPALAATNAESGQPKRTPYGTIVKEAWPQMYNVFIVFFVTLFVFPNVQSNIGPIADLDPTSFLGKYWTDLTCFLMFNFTALIGNITASLVQFPSRRWLAVLTTLRFAFVPFFLLCNYQPPEMLRNVPVYIDNDWIYLIGVALFGWSSGHASSLAMMYVSSSVAPELAATTGMIGGAMLITGITAGVTASKLAPMFVATSTNSI